MCFFGHSLSPQKQGVAIDQGNPHFPLSGDGGSPSPEAHTDHTVTEAPARNSCHGLNPQTSEIKHD